MKLVKSLLLGSAAGLTVAAGAQAADMPARAAPAPVEYVRVCSAHGVGFFYIPGTETCLRISGRVRAEYQFTTTRSYANSLANGDVSGFSGQGWVNIDARTQTSYGTLRGFIRYIAAYQSGGYLTSGTAQRFAYAFPALGQDTFGRAQTQFNLNKAFIQFAGITAGRASSFFDFYAHDHEFIAATPGSDVSQTNLFAYTATLGGGFSATLALEDPSSRRQPVFSNVNVLPGTGALSPIPAGPNLGNFGPTVFASQVPVAFDPITGQPTAFQFIDVTQRERVPDVVAALRVDQSWGSAQLSGAIHEISLGKYQGSFGTTVGGATGLGNVFSAGAVGPGGAIVGFPGLVAPGAVPGAVVPVVGGAGGTVTLPATGGGIVAAAGIPGAILNTREPDSEYGWAVQGGVKINLPMIAAGDVFYLQAAYAEGATSYTGVGRFNGYEANTNPINGRFNVNVNDAFVGAFGRLTKSESWSVSASFLHYWTPQIRQAIFGGYGRIEFPGGRQGVNAPLGAFPAFGATTAARTAAANAFAFSSTLKDWDQYNVGTNLIWSPVRDLDIGVEAVYSRIDIAGRVADLNKVGIGGSNVANVVGGLPSTTVSVLGLPLGIPAKTVSYDDVWMARFRIQRDF